MADEQTKKPAPGGHDVVLLHGRTEDGQGFQAIRARPDRLELAELRPVREGQPLGSAELIALRPRKESPVLWDVEVQYSPGDEGTRASGRSGPPRVSNRQYRANWDTIFGRPAPGRRRHGKGVLPGDDDPKSLN